MSEREPRMTSGLNDELRMRSMSRRSFIWAGLAVLGLYSGFRWLNSRREEDGLVWPLRRSLDFTDSLSKDLVQRQTPEFRSQQAGVPKENGDYGEADIAREDFELTLAGRGKDDLTVTMDQILALPKTQITTELHCIEGWTKTVQWGGVPLATFLAKYPPVDSGGKPIGQADTSYPQYLQMETDDGAYFVGLDMESALHPQTMLCYEMNGKPLPQEHGGPLRLVIPVKYGVKNIKWLATIAYSSDKTRDYWAEQGYDWFAGL